MKEPGAGIHSRLTYFTYTGWIIFTMLAVTAIVRLRLGDRGWMFTWQLIAVGLVSLAFLLIALARAYPGRAREIFSRAPFRYVKAFVPTRISLDVDLGPDDGSGVGRRRFRSSSRSLVARVGRIALVVATLIALVLDHRAFAIVLAALETGLIVAFRPRSRRSTIVLVFVMAAVTWGLAIGITYTHLADWLLNAGPSAGLAACAFVFSVAFVIAELAGEAKSGRKPWRATGLVVLAVLIFAAYALRTDHLLSDWVPIHRSYFADIANFVRDGHRLLWDVPSLYGFLSILTLAVMPVGNGWQAVYELTAVFLTLEAIVVFLIIRWGRGGWTNGLFAVLLPLGMVLGDSISRYPWSARLYPQGGLRFFWIVAILFVIFLSYVWREMPRRVATLRWCGFVLWTIALFWSFESAIWASCVWVPYVMLDALARPALSDDIGWRLRQLARCGWPLVALPLGGFVTIETFYVKAFGAMPDWRGYFDFTGLFASGSVREIFHVQVTGAAWSIVLILGVLGALAIAAIRGKNWDLFRLLAGAWLAVWATSSYYAVEPLDLYVTLLDGVFAPAMAIAIFASRELKRESGTALMARLSLAPIAIIVIAIALGEPGRLAAMRLPGMPGWTFDVIQQFQPISGELGDLIKRAHISPDDYVAVPNGRYWTELSQGLILPFAARPDGSIVEYRSWLPTSPVAPEMLLNGLKKSRRDVYVERFLDVSGHGGWLITYRQPADCAHVSRKLSTLKTYSSPNFSIGLCALNE